MQSAARYLLLLVLAQACQQRAETTPPLPTAEAPAAAPARPAPTLAQRVGPIISGYWISARYLDAVRRTRSPQAAIEHFPNYPVTMLIEPASATADSTHASLVLNLHEGSDMTIFFRPGTAPTALPARTLLGEAAGIRYELAYHLSPADTVLYVVKRSRQRVLGRLAYRRVARVAPGQDYVAQLNDGVARTLGKLLVAGSYAGTDSAGQPLRVQFLPGGQVRGLPFRTYHVLEDFLGGPTGGDALIFNMYQKDQQQLGASYGRDTLRLYSQHEKVGILPGGTDSVLTIERGRLRYQLVRRRQP